MESSKNGEVFLTFIEPDQAEYATRLEVPSCAVWPTFEEEREMRSPDVLSSDLRKGGKGPEPSPLNVGILGTSTRLSVKNFFPQAGAACLFDNANIYLNTLDVVEGFSREQVASEWHLRMCRGKFNEIGYVTTKEFNSALSRMDINLYVSASDAVPNVVLNRCARGLGMRTEKTANRTPVKLIYPKSLHILTLRRSTLSHSLAFGVPVISSDTSSIYESSPFLKNLLVEPRIDDQVAIYERAAKVLEFLRSKKNREIYDNEIDQLFTGLDRKAKESWGCLQQSTYGAPRCIDKLGNCNFVVA